MRLKPSVELCSTVPNPSDCSLAAIGTTTHLARQRAGSGKSIALTRTRARRGIIGVGMAGLS
ncbi:hypothetical protein BV20DRAFT_210524 [Pilatotrama ljubarskyi]|nr:hypothetical protein BV20DRAFT_560196 [Pilatotrama ljubarskyi]KAI0371083.1 hypothetical protein BV20DRAFT_210524 [Pilatotrama ljubarskyi]